jgi:hypothetical protein
MNLTTLLVVAAVAVSPTERMVLTPIAGAHVTAAAVAGAAASGTRTAFTVSGVRPHARLRAILNAGTCKARSASFATAGSARAGAGGRASWTARLRFHGTDVAWSSVSDGSHVLVLLVDGKPAACGAIPGMD